MLRKWLFLLAAFVVLLLAGGCGAKAPRAPQSTTTEAPVASQAGTAPEKAAEPEVDVAGAEEVFNGKCEGCHGPTRAGATGPALLPDTHGDIDEDWLVGVVANGREGTAMPAFGGQLTEGQIRNVVRFIKSVPPDKAPTWGFKEMEETHRVYVKPEDYPAKPNHNHRLDNIFFVVEREVSKGAFIDGDTFEVIKEEPFGFAIHEIEYTHDGRFGYTVARNGQVVKFDLYTLEKVAEIRAGLNARGVAISHDNKYILVGNYLPFNMVILSADDLSPVKIIEARGKDPSGKEVDSRVAAVATSGKHHVFLAALKEAGQIWIVDYNQPDFPVTKITDVGKILHDYFFDETGAYWMGAAQLSNETVIVDVANRKIAAKIPTGVKPHPGIGAFWRLSDGRQVAATVHIGEGKFSVWEVGTWKVLAETKTDGPGLFVKTHPRSKYVWADVFTGEHKDVIHVIDKETFKIVKTLKPSPGKASIHPEFTDDGKHVLVSIWDKDGEIVVYDADTLEEVTRIKGLVTPTGKFNSGTRIHKLDVGTY